MPFRRTAAALLLGQGKVIRKQCKVKIEYSSLSGDACPAGLLSGLAVVITSKQGAIMRHGIKILGLTLMAAIGMMAVAATAANAEGSIFVNGAEAGTTETSVQGEVTSASFKLVIPGLGITIQCKKGTGNFAGGNLGLTKGHLHGLLLVLSEECSAVGSALCKIYPTEADRTSKTNAGKIHSHVLFLFLKFAGATVFTFAQPILPGEPALISSFFFTKGEGCVLPSNNLITGTAGGKTPEGTTELTEHEVNDLSIADEEALAKEEMSIGMLEGKERVEVVESTAKGHLTGANAGKKFSIK